MQKNPAICYGIVKPLAFCNQWKMIDNRIVRYVVQLLKDILRNKLNISVIRASLREEEAIFVHIMSNVLS